MHYCVNVKMLYIAREQKTSPLKVKTKGLFPIKEQALARDGVHLPTFIKKINPQYQYEYNFSY